MPLIRRLFPRGALVFVVACGSEPGTEPEPEPTPAGTLAVALQTTPPSLTNANSVQITGTVTRTPAASDQTVTVTATGGPSNASATASASGSFTLTVSLAPNAQTTLTISASDPSGSTSNSLTVTVRHDGVLPQVSSMAPAHLSEGTAPATIAVQFSEPIRPSAALAVRRHGSAVAGSAALSADSLTLTFTPTAAFRASTVHVVTLSGVVDAVGNAGPTLTQCFVTGGTPTVFDDGGADATWVAATPSLALEPPELTQIRVARVGTDLHWLLKFATSKSLNLSDPANFLAWLDLDLDENGSTGFATVKDTLLRTLLPNSGARAEYAIAVGSQASPADSSAAGVLSDWGTIPLAGAFLFVPELCGQLVGFLTPLSALGGDDGGFRIVTFLQSSDATGLRADAAPDSSFYDVNLTSPLVGTGASPRVSRSPGVIRAARIRDWAAGRRQ